ncbi:class I SAM-dependent methyltransferase [Mesorhizobium australafricanum]|uniref:Methyltransferase domain-containing protein n=1 Tax=Mesorhizobium australafricanum TaxID=3072311 RepID=A0ABU4X1J0_9HYPH|nr:methyltransferase domain-containing protein [Mesorhizobium sp. VK3E]MDX8442182.1 methyltransferase domain-containing protein [Mesorhizobium sp. VK3E]
MNRASAPQSEAAKISGNGGRSLLLAFVRWNTNWTEALDQWLPLQLRLDGHQEFKKKLLPPLLLPGSKVYDLGGGSQPSVSLKTKSDLALTVVGLDISEDELKAAPVGIYDQTVVADLCTYSGAGDGDLVVCQATLEHVRDTAGAMRAIASCLKPGGRAAIFAPCRNAAFARLNLLLPQELKRRLLYALFPHKAEGHDGFPALYDNCTPRDIEQLSLRNGLAVEQAFTYWRTSYFMILVPAYLLWRIWQRLAFYAVGRQAAESFCFVLRKRDS